jgi:two-component system response regulator NreC
MLSMRDDPQYVRQAFAAGASGYVLKQAADISVRTAETHRAHIMHKLRLGSRTELVCYALAHGLLEE